MIPSIGSELTYETNPDNTSNRSAEDDAAILSIGLSARLNVATQKNRLSSEPLIRWREAYDNNGSSQLDGTDFVLPITASHSARRSQTSVSASYSQLPSREADYQVVDPNSPLPPGGLGCQVDARGRCRVDETQSRWYLGPAYNYTLSPRLLFGVNAGYSATRYDEAEITGRFDYDYLSGSVSLTRILTPQHRLSLSINASRYDADQQISALKNLSETSGLNISYDYALTPSTNVTVAAGASFSEFTISGRTTVGGLPCFDPATNEFVACETRGEDTNFVGELFLRQQLADAITGQIGISRSVQPNSDGAETTVDYATAFIQRDLSERLKVSAGVSYTKQEAIGADTIDILRQRFDRTYSRIEAGTSWRIARQWTISGKYAYSLDDQGIVTPSGFGNISVESRNHIFTLQLGYVGIGFR